MKKLKNELRKEKEKIKKIKIKKERKRKNQMKKKIKKKKTKIKMKKKKKSKIFQMLLSNLKLLNIANYATSHLSIANILIKCF